MKILLDLQYIRPVRRGTRSSALFVAILFFTAFDHGITSTGNAFHVLAWIYTDVPILQRHQRQFPEVPLSNQASPVLV